MGQQCSLHLTSKRFESHKQSLAQMVEDGLDETIADILGNLLSFEKS
jgi:hypothetical protein